MQNLFTCLLNEVTKQLTNKPKFNPLQLRSYSETFSSKDASSIETLIIELEPELIDDEPDLEVLDFDYYQFIQNYITENLMLDSNHKLITTNKTGWQTQMFEVQKTFNDFHGDDVYQYFSVLITDQTIYITRINPAL